MRRIGHIDRFDYRNKFRKNSNKRIIFLVLFFIIFFVVAHQSYNFWWRTAKTDAIVVALNIESGSGLSVVASDLKNDNLISNIFWFKIYSFISGRSSDVKAGGFELVDGMSYSDIFSKISEAHGNDVAITIPEGYTIKQIGEVVINNFDITEEQWNTATGQFSPLENHKFVVYSQKPNDVDLEGYLFPDTYRFFNDATAEDIVKRMIDEMRNKVGEPDLDSGWTMHEVLTLASIVEREVINPDEMAMIADIFLKRLEAGMPLQSDATVNYIIDGDNPSPLYSDLEIDSLYNTYKYAGLPPGPISNPGINSIEAVLNPTVNDYYYFLTTDEGEVIFSKSFDEHIRNKNFYLD